MLAHQFNRKSCYWSIWHFLKFIEKAPTYLVFCAPPGWVIDIDSGVEQRRAQQNQTHRVAARRDLEDFLLWDECWNKPSRETSSQRHSTRPKQSNEECTSFKSFILPIFPELSSCNKISVIYAPNACDFVLGIYLAWPNAWYFCGVFF